MENKGMLIYNGMILGVEIELTKEDSFLLIKETLTRIGIASYKNKQLWQSCHILHKKGKYYIIHFKELFMLDGKHSSLTVDDQKRRTAIAKMVENWGLCRIVEQDIPDIEDVPKINIIRYSDKHNWDLISKYNIGNS